MELEPYLFFYGRCEEALNFYKDVFGGEVSGLARFSDAPPQSGMEVPDKTKVMHANFEAPGLKFMASDGGETKYEGGNISLSLGAGSLDEAKRIFDKLAAGGKVEQPLSDAFWGGKFGMVTDKFGIDWMMSAP